MRAAVRLIGVGALCALFGCAAFREPPELVRGGLATSKFLIASWGRIYVPEDRWEAYNRIPLGAIEAAVLAHEIEHIHRQREGSWLGMTWWHIRYVTSPNFRWAEERAGYAVQLKVLYDAGQLGAVMPRAGFIRTVTDPFYFAMVTAEEAGRWYDLTVMSLKAR